MAFAELISEIPTLGILKKSIESARIGHAYLFTGADRETLDRAAVAFAKSVNCTRQPMPVSPRPVMLPSIAIIARHVNRSAPTTTVMCNGSALNQSRD